MDLIYDERNKPVRALQIHQAKSGAKLQTLIDCYDEKDLYYENVIIDYIKKEPIPENTIVDILGIFLNHQGSFFRVIYNNCEYDIHPKNLGLPNDKLKPNIELIL